MLLSIGECKHILSFWNEDKSIASTKYLEGKIDEVNTIKFRTKVSGRYLDSNNPILRNFLLSKLSSIGIVSLPEYVKIARYCEGDYFEPHHDFNFYGEGSVFKTLVIQLTDENEYEGGTLYVLDKPQSRTQGDYSLFLSKEIHEVKLITSGIRYSLTYHLSEDNFVYQKTAI